LEIDNARYHGMLISVAHCTTGEQCPSGLLVRGSARREGGGREYEEGRKEYEVKRVQLLELKL
jgi:hypothetical protein